MIEACSSTRQQTATRATSNSAVFEDPFFASDGFSTAGMDELDGHDLFGLLGEDPTINDGEGYANVGDDLHLSTEQPFLTSLQSDSHYQPSAEDSFLSPAISTSSDGQHSASQAQTSPDGATPPGDYPPPPSPVVIDPTEIDKISIQLEKNQQCRCKSCNKLFNSVWYLKQHAVKHSNDRPFQCKFCRKTYKFRSNLYQHKCPERNRQLGTPNGIRKRFYTRGIAYTELKGENPQQPPQGQPLQVSTPNTKTPDTSLSAPYEPQGGFQQPPPLEHSSDIQFDLIPIETPSLHNFEPSSPMAEKKQTRPENSIRERQLDPAYIEDYLARKRHKLFTCRKCKFQFPTRGHLAAHMTAHNLAEAYCYICPQCPQKFCEERRLRNHLELHASDPNSASHRCRQCDGAFRSALALRRHIDQSRSCYSHPFGIRPQLMISPAQPIDPYAFIESDEENENKTIVEDLQPAGIKRHIDDSDTSIITSPPRSGILEEEYDEKTPEDSNTFEIPKRCKKSSENEDADSGFRSRLNSNQSCSPSSHSAISSGSDSPGRKYSQHEYGNTRSGYEAMAGPSGTNYGNGCYTQGPPAASMSMNVNPATHYSYALIEAEEVGVDSDALGCQISRKSIYPKSFRPSINLKASIFDGGLITQMCDDIPDFLRASPFGDLNSFEGFPSETFETSVAPVIEIPKELKAILAIFLDTLIQSATRHRKSKT